MFRGQDDGAIRIDDAAEADDATDSSISHELPLPPTSLNASVPLDGSDASTTGDGELPELGSALVVTSLPGSGDSFGLFSVDFRSAPRVDLPQSGTLSMPTGWGITWLDGPTSMDLPPQLYHLTIDMGGVSRVNDQWTFDLGVTPGWFTDFENRRPEAFRMMGRAVAYRDLDSHRQVAAGFVYLDRDDIPALPVVGMVLDDPDAGYHHELVFPRPRLSWRWKETVDTSRWVYVGSELGGGSWAIKRQDRTPDVVTLRDLRLLGGLEFRSNQRRLATIEAGVVFGREIETRTGIGDYSPPATGMVRMWLDY